MSKNKASTSVAARTPMLEWLLGSIGVALLIASVVFLVYEGLVRDERPGVITVSVKDILAVGAAHLVTFELRNEGNQTLSNVQVSASIADANRELERVHTVIDFLPGHSRQAGGFYFKNDPRPYRLEIKPEGFQEP